MKRGNVETINHQMLGNRRNQRFLQNSLLTEQELEGHAHAHAPHCPWEYRTYRNRPISLRQMFLDMRSALLNLRKGALDLINTVTNCKLIQPNGS